MLLTLTTTHRPATELGYLLHKHPARLQSFTLSFGRAHVYYLEATEARCTAALLLDVDPIGLSRTRKGAQASGQPLEPYVNDRPYVASSFLSVAIAQVFGSALAGRCQDRPELVASPLPLEARLAVLPCRGGEAFLHRLFEPLGYTITAERHPLDPRFPEWGDSPYFTVTLNSQVRLQDLLGHLYVLVPVLDDQKHYWVGDDEVDKLVRHGAGWLAAHPEREQIARRYLKHRRSLTQDALARLTVDERPDPEAVDVASDAEEAAVEEPLSLNAQRLASVIAALKEHGARRVLDLGCGEGKLLRELLHDPQFEEIVGIDVSPRALDVARDQLKLERLPDRQRARITLRQGSLTYRDRRLADYDAAAVVEVVEHLEPSRLPAFERVVFEGARPKTVVLTTPNADYNVHWTSLPAGAFRHRDHRFEWTRDAFRSWATGVAERYGYVATFHPVGPEDDALGAPTQMGVFTRV